VPGLCGAMPALAQKEAPPQARCTALATGAIAGLAGMQPWTARWPMPPPRPCPPIAR
jgi:hypothetical protein